MYVCGYFQSGHINVTLSHSQKSPKLIGSIKLTTGSTIQIHCTFTTVFPLWLIHSLTHGWRLFTPCEYIVLSVPDFHYIHIQLNICGFLPKCCSILCIIAPMRHLNWLLNKRYYAQIFFFHLFIYKFPCRSKWLQQMLLIYRRITIDKNIQCIFPLDRNVLNPLSSNINP